MAQRGARDGFGGTENKEAKTSLPERPRLQTDMAVDAADDAPASWASMPKKLQLAMITLARCCESASASSLQSYIFFQLKSMTLPDGSAPSTAAVALQLSALSATMAMPQLITSSLWGFLADHPRVGRKRVLLVGFIVTAVGSLGLGFATSFAGFLMWRLLSALSDGNAAVMRTIIHEISGEKFESRAVLLLPTAFNVGSIIGPVLGSLLAAPTKTQPEQMAADGHSQWRQTWPYALPNIANALMLLTCAALLASQLEETLVRVKRRQRVSVLPDWAKRLLQRKSQPQYQVLVDQDQHEYELDSPEQLALPKLRPENDRGPVSIWTRRLCMTLLARALASMHIFAYPPLLIVFMSTARYNPVDVDADGAASAVAGSTTNGTASASLYVPPGYRPHGPFTFTGGLSFKPRDIAKAFAIRGFVGLLLQLLFFPYLKGVFGTMKLYRSALLIFPATYFLTPYIATVASTTLPPSPAGGIPVWVTFAAILTVQTTARSFALPAATMLLNAACPDTSALATVNGIAQSIGSVSRAIGRVLIGWLYGVGLTYGIVGTAWWTLAAIAVFAAMAGACIPAENDDRETIKHRRPPNQRYER